MTRIEIANTILNQLGGNHFVVMTGAKNFVTVDNGLRFQIGKNSSKANVVKVMLQVDDTYTMQFWNKGREFNPYTLMVKYFDQGMSEEQVKVKVAAAEKNAEPKMLKEYNGLFFDQLQEFFTEYTHMNTKLF